MAIADDFTIDYVNQRIYHSSGTTVYSVNQLYSYTTVTFDDDVQMDDLPPMSAQTPTAFTMENGWFIDEVSLQYLNGGSLTTLGWNSSVSYPTGIRVFTFSSDAGAVSGDIGKPVVYAAAPPTDSGTLLYYNTAGTKWWVRTDDENDTFADFSEAVSVTGGTGTGTMSAASTTGENTWANVFTLGTIATNTQIYLYQEDAQITPWWSTGHIDVLVLVKEAGTLIDYGYVTIFARQYTKLYDHYQADLSAGARTPIPLATFDDSNNLSGYRQMVLTNASDNFTVGEIIQDDSDSTIQGLVTSSSGTAPDITVQYYLYNSTQTDFSAATGTFTGQTSSETATAVAPTDVGPANLTTSPTIVFGGGDDYNLNNGNGARQYDVVIDCNQNTLADVYEYLKYMTRYGQTTTTLNGHTGESYVGVGDLYITYSNLAGGTFTEGNTVSGSISGATGIVVADHSANPSAALTLRDITGTWSATDVITDGGVTADADAIDTISPSKQSPFGTFAGGKFFGARGVWLTDYIASEGNNFQLIDSTNTAQIPPTSITLTVAGILSGDQVAVFRATDNNNTVDKSMYNIQAAHTTGVGYIRISESIPNDTPGQTTGGFIRVVRRDASGTILGEEKYEYVSWNNTNQPTYSSFVLTGSSTPITTQDYDTDDTVYVPYIDDEATDVTIDTALIYVSNRYVTCRVRKSGILPFMIKSQIQAADLTITAVRATDSIA